MCLRAPPPLHCPSSRPPPLPLPPRTPSDLWQRQEAKKADGRDMGGRRERERAAAAGAGAECMKAGQQTCDVA